MFRGHHDSSQLSAALFGGGDSNLPPQKQTSQFQYQNNDRQDRNYPQNSADRRRDWEDRLVSSGVYYGNENDSGPKKPTPPTDKPPDPYRQQQQQQQSPQPQRQQYYDPFSQQPSPNKSPQPQCNQSLTPYNQSHQQFGQQPHQLQQSQISLQLQQGMMSQNPGTMAIPIPIPNGGGMYQSAPNTPQYFPMQMPLGGPGFGNYPMFFVMSSQFPPDIANKMSSSAPSTSDLVLQSISSASSMESSRWSTPPDTRGSLSTSQTQGSKSLSRAKWGEKGVGVGRLWNPEASMDEEIYGHRSKEALSPPQWAELSQSDGNVLPGAPNSRPGEKTHARGSAVVLDSQEMAERNRKQRQAHETQRIIQQQLDEKKRLQQEEVEREKKEAALWEERVKMQQERERKELEEENRKKKEKEETEERRQQKLMEAIQEAAENARRLKDENRFKNKPFIETRPSQEIYPESSGLETARTGRPTNLSNEPILEKDEEVEEAEYNNEEIDERKEVNESASSPPKLDLPDIVASAQVGTLSPVQKLTLLRALGIAPELLLSSGVFEKSSFMSLLGESKGSGPSTVPEEEWDYTRNITITPTKFRTSRDCGVQCDGYSSDLNYPEKRSIRRRNSKRQKSKEEKETPRSSPEDKPQWGRHRSERPYRKQSEKDPYQGRRFRRKPVRSISVSDGRDSNTDQDSDPQTGTHEVRRRRKTWGESLQESLSSDLSRSPSPKSRKGPKINLPRGPPPIKQPLTPSLQHDKLNDSTSSGTSKRQEAQITNHRSNHNDGSASAENEKSVAHPGSKENDDEAQPKELQRNLSLTEKQPFRSTSPPVPAIAGTSKFDIPEYPPGFEFPSKQPSGDKGKSATENTPSTPPSTSPSNPSSTPPSTPPGKNSESLNVEEPFKSPSMDVGTRTRQMSLPNIARKRDLLSEGEADSTNSNHSSAMRRRASLTSGPRMNPELPTKIKSLTRPSSSASLPRSPTQRSSTPRRLPPLGDQSPSSEETLPPSFVADANKENNQSRTVGLGPEDEDRITPVEVTTTPRVGNQLSLSPTTESLVTLAASPNSRRKKESSDSGVSVDVSRPSSASSQIEEILGTSNNSYGYSYLKSSSKEPKDLTVPLADPDDWIILRSLSPVRQNFWRRTVQQAGSKSTS